MLWAQLSLLGSRILTVQSDFSGGLAARTASVRRSTSPADCPRSHDDGCL